MEEDKDQVGGRQMVPTLCRSVAFKLISELHWLKQLCKCIKVSISCEYCKRTWRILWDPIKYFGQHYTIFLTAIAEGARELQPMSNTRRRRRMMEGGRTLSKKSARAGHQAVSLHRGCVLVLKWPQTQQICPNLAKRNFAHQIIHVINKWNVK